MTSPATFSYEAVSPSGGMIRGQVQAASLSQALERIRGKRLLVLSVARAISKSTKPGLDDLSVTFSSLARFLEAGVPVVKALHALESVSPPGMRSSIPLIRDAMRDGRSFSEAILEANLALPTAIMGIMRAAERSGDLRAGLARAAELADRSAQWRRSMLASLWYPAVLALTSVASIGLLAGFVLPRFAQMLSDLGQQLPPTTRLVLGAASFARAAVIPAVITVALVAALMVLLLRSSRFGSSTYSLLERVPFLGGLSTSIATARVAEMLAVLLEAGVPAPAALGYAASSTQSPIRRARIGSARKHILEGERVSTALHTHRVLTPLAFRLVAAGEAVGQLDHGLRHAAGVEDELARRRLARALRVIEPSLIIGFGGMIGLVAASLLQAIYSVRP